MQRGEFITGAAEEVGTYRKKGTWWMAAAGGVRPRRGRDLKRRYLSFAEREEIALARASGESVRCIARRLGRSPSTVSSELHRNADRGGCYRATTAHARAWERACRPKPAKLHVNLRLREIVQRDLERNYSPEQIAGRLRIEFPDEMEMWVSTETIYQNRDRSWLCPTYERAGTAFCRDGCRVVDGAARWGVEEGTIVALPPSSGEVHPPHPPRPRPSWHL